MPNPAIEAVGDDIDEPVVDNQFDSDVGIGARKVGQPRQDGVDGRNRCCQSNANRSLHDAIRSLTAAFS